MSTRLPVLAAASLIGLVLLLAACGAPAPPAGSPTESSTPPTASPSTVIEASVTIDSTPPSPASVDVETAGSTDAGPTGSEEATAPDGALGPALDAIIPGLGAAGDGPFMEVCGQISIGSERWLVETVAAGEYAPAVAGGFITPEDAAKIVDAIEPYCA